VKAVYDGYLIYWAQVERVINLGLISCPVEDLSFRGQGAGSRGKKTFGIFAQIR
jgi:hypothetical protein